MKLPDNDIRKAIYEALFEVLTVPVRDMIARPEDIPPYVIIANQNGFDDSLKCTFGQNHSVLLQIYGKQQNNVSRAEIESIADEITNTLIPITINNYISTNRFQIVDIHLDSTSDDVVFTGDKVSARKNIIINFLIREFKQNILTT